LQNGVEHYEKIKSIFPETEVWDACVYIVSKIIEPGFIQETGGIQQLYFGNRDGESFKQCQLEGILKAAGLNANTSDKILSMVWEKFLFISSIASCTAYLNKTIGEILANNNYLNLFHELLNEIYTIIIAENIVIRPDIFESVYQKMKSFPFESSSSMHRDFINKGPTELESLTGEVVKRGKVLGIATPFYNLVYESLSKIESINQISCKNSGC
jgi:2-dehydropantoate 2-reductase